MPIKCFPTLHLQNCSRRVVVVESTVVVVVVVVVVPFHFRKSQSTLIRKWIYNQSITSSRPRSAAPMLRGCQLPPNVFFFPTTLHREVIIPVDSFAAESGRQ